MSGKTYHRILSAVVCVSLLLNSLWGVFLYPQTVFAQEPSANITFDGLDELFAGIEGIVKIKVSDVSDISDETLILYRGTLIKDGGLLVDQVVYFPDVGSGDDPDDRQTWSLFTTNSEGQVYFGPSEGFPLGSLSDLKTDVGVETPFAVTLEEGSYSLKVEILQAIDDLALIEETIGFDVNNPQKYIQFIEPLVGVYGGESTTLNLVVEAKYEPHGVNRVRFRYVPPGETCQQQYTHPYFHDLDDGTRNGDAFTQTWDISGFVSGEYTICALMHKNGGSEGYVDVNHAEVTINIDNTPPDAPELLFPEDQVLINSNNLYVDWSDVTDPNGQIKYKYQLYLENPTENPDVSIRYQKDYYEPVSRHPSAGFASGTPEDTYWWRIRACDQVENCSQWTDAWQFTVDNTSPTTPGQIGWTAENPPEGEDYEGGTDFENYRTCGQSLNYSPMTNFWQPSTDNIGVIGYEREVYSPEEAQIYSTTLSTNYQNGGGAIDGTTYWVRARAFDAAGNFSPWTEKCAITYDETPPSTILTSPENDSYWDTAITVRGISTDNFLVDLVNLFQSVTGVSDWQSITNITNTEENNPFDWSYLWTPEKEGAYDIKAAAVDVASNEEVSAYVYNVTFDNTQPTITNVSANKDYVKAGDELTITADVTDASGISAVSADFSYNVGYTDRPQPTSVAMQNVGGSTYKTIYTVPSSWNEGVMYIRVAARDGTGGNWVRSNDYDTVIVDNTVPQIKFEIPENGSTHAGIISLKATCDEECNYINFWWRAEGEAYDSGSKRYHYIYDNGTVFEWDLDSLNAEKWDGDTYVMEDGAYYLYAAGKDLAGNWARTLDVQIIVDNTSPRSFFISPSDGGIFGGPEEEQIHIEGYSTDESANTVASTSLFYRTSGETPGEWQLLKTFENTANDEPFNWKIGWTPKEDGTYDFKAVATDKAGNIEETAYAYGVIYDTTKPTLEWTSPAGGTIISGTTVILSVATDNLSGVDSVTYLYQREGEVGWHKIAILTNSPYEYNWNTTGLELGTYNLKAVAIDNAANLVEITRQVEVAAVISGETWNRPEFGKITVSWTTDRATSGRVVYDTTSHSIDSSHPNYGYTNTSGTVDISPKTTSHTVTLSELLNGITYYWRTVSTGSPIVISKEHRGDTFSIPGPPAPPEGEGLVEGATIGVITTPFGPSEIEEVSISEEEVLGEETTTVTSPEDLEGFGESVLGKSKIIRVILWGGAVLGGLILIYFFFRRRKRR